VLVLTPKGVDVFIKRFSSKDRQSYWDNYNLIIWKKNPTGFSNKNGLFKNNSWGISENFPISTDGTWKMSDKYVKYFK
jgi:hypothetical protein